jgi:hypothetical protein
VGLLLFGSHALIGKSENSWAPLLFFLSDACAVREMLATSSQSARELTERGAAKT